MKKHLLLPALIIAISLLLVQGEFHLQIYETSLYADEGNPNLSILLKKGNIGELTSFGNQHIGFYTSWSTSYLKATGKEPKKPVVKGDADSDDLEYEYNQALERWSCMYSAYSAMDGNTGTAWCEGKKDNGIGEILVVKADISKSVYIWNGLGASDNLYKTNNRAQKIRVTVLQAKQASKEIGQYNIGIRYKDITVLGSHEITLKDLNGWQPLPLPSHKRLAFISESENGKPVVNDEDSTFIAIEILSVYKGTKYNDTCISEIGNGGKDK